MEEHSSETTNNTILPGFDWHFGPFAFQAKQVELWTKYSDGDMYDAQLVPIVHAFRKGLKVCSVFCNYQHPKEMKDEEQGNVVATRVLQGLSHECDEEACRVVQMMKFDVERNRGVHVLFHQKVRVQFKKPKQVPPQSPVAQPQMQVAYTVTSTTSPKPKEKPAEVTYNYSIKI